MVDADRAVCKVHGSWDAEQRTVPEGKGKRTSSILKVMHLLFACTNTHTQTHMNTSMFFKNLGVLKLIELIYHD